MLGEPSPETHGGLLLYAVPATDAALYWEDEYAEVGDIAALS
jgi:hypothetical protein